MVNVMCWGWGWGGGGGLIINGMKINFWGVWVKYLIFGG